MLLRLYFLFPEKSQVQQSVEELNEAGIKNRSIHVLARNGVDLSGLPQATKHQKSDLAAKIEHLLWNINLGLFFVALAFLIYGLLQGYWILGFFMALLMAATFIAGNYFVTHVPHTHLDQFQGALSHREILLMVDVPAWRIREIEYLIRKHHPEAGLDGVGWALQGFGI